MLERWQNTFLMKALQLLAILFTTVVFSGCAGLTIVPLSSDTYLASKTSGGGIWVAMDSIRSEVISAANSFAESKGKVAVALSAREKPAVPGRNPSFEYQFRLVDKDSPAAKGVALVPRADVVIEKTEKISADIQTKEIKSPDLYTELSKLDDLRKRGIITDEEFAAQKKRLLEKQ